MEYVSAMRPPLINKGSAGLVNHEEAVVFYRALLP
jgi:hypothetical protein